MTVAQHDGRLGAPRTGDRSIPVGSRRLLRGFTLLEMLVVVGLIGVVLAIATPMITRSMRSREVHSSARRIVATLARARGLAGTGRTQGTSPPWVAGDRTRSAGIRITGRTSFALFIDRDAVSDGDEIIIENIDFNVEWPGTNVRIESPAAGQEIRFTPTGVVTSPRNVVLQDASTFEWKTVIVTGGGRSRIE